MTRAEAIVDSLLREADDLLLGLFSNALIGVYVIQDGHFIYVNQRLAELFGYSQDALCDRMGPLDLTAPGDRAIAQREIDRRIHGEVKASFYPFRGVRKDGSQIDVEVFGVSTRFAGKPAIIGMLLDVSERSAAERAVADQLRFIAKLIDTIPSPVFYKDEKGIYLGCNTAFEQYIGVERSKLIGRSVYDISPKDLADKYHAADQMLFDHPGAQTYEASVADADGKRRDVVFYKATFNKADGSLGGLVGVILDISERKQMEEAIWQQANYDALTGLPNRRLFRDRLGEEVKRAERNESGLAVLFIDLDRFKTVNDTLGHDVGDRLLVEAANRLRAAVRPADTVSRQGGDEFIVIVPDIADTDAAGLVARDILDALATPFDLGGRPAYVSASIGIAFYPEDSREIETLVGYADQAMYAAKASGRNGFCYFSQSMQDHAMHHLETGNDLRRAVAEGQFEVHYQPIVDLTDGRTVKAEALLRWNHPRRGMVSPAEFIPIAEEIGIIGEIGNWVFRQAMAAAGQWQSNRLTAPAGAQPPEPIQISINMSPRQFTAGISGDWIDYLKRHGLPPEVLAVEITEGLLLDDSPNVVGTLLAFRDAGIQVSIDDFGTGYSAMSYLKKFDIDYLKIDRSFVRDLATDPGDLAIAEAVIVMAHKLGLKVIAEGVETEVQRDLLRQAGCDYAQGFLYAKPMPLTDFQRFVADKAGKPCLPSQVDG
ncbi:MAG TPA: EAL domain-containing protein [Parasulfuritortus sp.]